MRSEGYGSRFVCVCVFVCPIEILRMAALNEQVAYKRGVAGPKKMATGINYCQNGRLAKAKVTLEFWTQALSHN